jgi:hypothetical protein
MIKHLLAAILMTLCLSSYAEAATISPVEVKFTNGMFAPRQSVYIDNRVLAANTAEAHTVPVDAANVKATYVIFSSTCDFYADFASTAVVPSADVTNGSGPELNPTARFLANDVTTISLITAADSCVVTMMFYM